MNFNVSNLLQESTGSVRQFLIQEVSPYTSDSENKTIEGKIRLTRTDKGIWASATLRTVVLGICSRCLDRCNLTIEIEIEEEFLPQAILIHSLSSTDEIYDQDSSLIDQYNILDLNDTIRQYVEINTPMSPLCVTNCLGLCFLCGGNLNVNRCVCEGLNIDPRWKKLQDFV